MDNVIPTGLVAREMSPAYLGRASDWYEDLRCSEHWTVSKPSMTVLV